MQGRWQLLRKDCQIFSELLWKNGPMNISELKSEYTMRNIAELNNTLTCAGTGYLWLFQNPLPKNDLVASGGNKSSHLLYLTHIAWQHLKLVLCHSKWTRPTKMISSSEHQIWKTTLATNKTLHNNSTLYSPGLVSVLHEQPVLHLGTHLVRIQTNVL